MDLNYTIGDRVIQIEDKVMGQVIKFYRPTACKPQTMILCDDGRKYHAPSDTFIKIDEYGEQITIEIGIPAGQLASQSIQTPHEYRNIKVTEGTVITVDLEELKKNLADSYYKRIGLNYEV